MRTVIFWASLALACGNEPTDERRADDVPLEVTYIANEGFMIESGAHKVLVDALFGREELEWCHVPTEEAREKLAAAREPFGDVDLVLVTHAHVDHFDPALVLSHLSNNPNALLIAPREAVVRLREQPAWTAGYGSRVEEIALELHATKSLSHAGIEVDVHRVRHGFYPEEDPETGEVRNRHERVEQLAFVVRLSGASFLHLGDAFLHENRAFFTDERFTNGAIDLVFLEGWTAESLEILEKLLAPQHVVLMHLPPQPEAVERIVSALAEVLPDAVAFRTRMDRRRFVVALE